ATLHVLEYDVRLAFTAEIDHAHDVGVMHTTEYARLALERLESFGVAIEVRVQHLHRKQATKSGVPGQAAHVHAPHATALEAREHFVATHGGQPCGPEPGGALAGKGGLGRHGTGRWGIDRGTRGTFDARR